MVNEENWLETSWEIQRTLSEAVKDLDNLSLNLFSVGLDNAGKRSMYSVQQLTTALQQLDELIGFTVNARAADAVTSSNTMFAAVMGVVDKTPIRAQLHKKKRRTQYRQ